MSEHWFLEYNEQHGDEDEDDEQEHKDNKERALQIIMNSARCPLNERLVQLFTTRWRIDQ